LPKESEDIPTRAIPIDADGEYEPVDKSQIELEVDIEKHGVPVIDVERPPVPDVHTDETPYKKVAVKRKEKRSDRRAGHFEPVPLDRDREMAAYAEELKIPKRKSIFTALRKKIYDFSCKIRRFILNMQRKRHSRVTGHCHNEHILPENVKTLALKYADEVSAESLGRKREFTRENDRSPKTVQMIRNNKTGVVVATPNVSTYRSVIEEKKLNVEDYEIVESQIKE